MHLSLEERETVIIFNEKDKEANVYTCNKSLIHKLDELMQTRKEITLEKEDEFSKTYNLPKKWIKVNASRIMTEEKRQKLAENARQRFQKKEENE